MMGKSSDVQIQIQPNLQIQIQIHSFKNVQIQSKSKSNLLKNLQIQIQIRGFKSKSTNPIWKSGGLLQMLMLHFFLINSNITCISHLRPAFTYMSPNE